jgi:hypothetical protein
VASVGIVYAEGSKAIRRIIVDAPDLGQHPLAKGEALLVADASDIDSCKAPLRRLRASFRPTLYARSSAMALLWAWQWPILPSTCIPRAIL